MLSGRFNIITTGKVFLLLMLLPLPLFAAIGCTLSNPAEDLKYLFPTMTSYKEELKEFGKLSDGKARFAALHERLGGDLDPLYEPFETPYTVYTVFKDKKKMGIVHGVNVPGRGGVIQVFLSVDPVTAVIKKFFFQRLESPAAKELRNKEFQSQFEGITLADFYTNSARMGKIKPPKLDASSEPDYKASLRGIR